MTPLEQSRFAAGVAMAADAPRGGLYGALESVRQTLDTARQNIISHHGWTSGVCDCLLDCTSCCAVIWCLPTVLAQFAERVWKIKHTCAFVAVLLWIVTVAQLIYQLYVPSCSLVPCPPSCLDASSCSECEISEVQSGQSRLVFDSETQQVRVAPVQMKLSVTRASLEACKTVQAYYDSPFFLGIAAVAFVFLPMTCLLTMALRAHIRKRDEIPPTIMAGLDDCLCALACSLCVVSQAMRHEGLTHGRYKILSTSGRDEALMV